MKHQPLNDLIDPDVPANDAPVPVRTPESRGIKYQTLNDLIDPDVPAADAPVPEPEPDPDAPEDAYVIGAPGKMILKLKDDAGKDKDGKDRLKRWVKPLAVLCALAFVALTVWNISRFAQGPPAPPAPSAFQMKQALYMGAIKVEAYRREHGVTPEALQDAGLASPYSYTRINPNTYVVAIDLHGSKLEYDSTVSLEKFFGTPQEMLNTEKIQ